MQSLTDDLAGELPAPVFRALPGNLSQETTIPLAALLVGYPVAYVPGSPDQSSFLSNVPLDVYECVLTFDESQQVSNLHTLLKFSCPSGLAQDHPDLLGPPQIIEHLNGRYRNRLQKAAPDTKLVVLHSSETLDRVAL
jgi:hypothetical protein